MVGSNSKTFGNNPFAPLYGSHNEADRPKDNEPTDQTGNMGFSRPKRFEVGSNRENKLKQRQKRKNEEARDEIGISEEIILEKNSKDTVMEQRIVSTEENDQFEGDHKVAGFHTVVNLPHPG
ncbi:OLC1v1004854C1 [Oldenlandia corymbosa var. corymbosa]|uniref:OLC1v1004854C1 n=1 Tax=Oldenlandia corymbosa var. corymbosa TaxID=529605 RepID=A0AAV1DGR4_OLDCO|nr:OLC1v1004854C1 [Oldenlandia corymbosa var. corymbosa]